VRVKTIHLASFDLCQRLTKLDSRATIGLPDREKDKRKASLYMATNKNAFKVSVSGGRSVQTMELSLVHPLLSYQVKLYSPLNASESNVFKLGCPQCHKPISQPRQCTNTECKIHGVLSEQNKPTRIFVEGDTIVPVGDDELDDFELDTKNAFITSAIVPFKEVEPLTAYSEGMYFITPATMISAELYALTVQTLKKSKQVLVGKYTTARSNKELLGIVRVMDNCLILQEIPFYSQKRDIPQFDLPKVAPHSVETFEKIVAEIPNSFDYNATKDEFSAAVLEYVKKKISKTLPAKKKTEGMNAKEGANALELMLAQVLEKKSKSPKKTLVKA